MPREKAEYRRVELRWKKGDLVDALDAEAARRGMSLQKFTQYVILAYYQATQGDASLLDELVRRPLPTVHRMDNATTMVPPLPIGHVYRCLYERGKQQK